MAIFIQTHLEKRFQVNRNYIESKYSFFRSTRPTYTRPVSITLVICVVRPSVLLKFNFQNQVKQTKQIFTADRVWIGLEIIHNNSCLVLIRLFYRGGKVMKSMFFVKYKNRTMQDLFRETLQKNRTKTMLINASTDETWTFQQVTMHKYFLFSSLIGDSNFLLI